MNKFYVSLSPKLFFAMALLLAFCFTAKAQNCFEITSILVDACGSPEGENEMVRFDVGNAPLAITDLDITWPSNSFKGICQDSITALKVDTLNNGIVGCGLLVEPTGGMLPANAKVLLVTSTDFSTTFNSFANLNDTLIIIFQCSGNIAGHFANNSSTPGLRTLIMSFLNPAGCVDSVTYDRTLLVNQGGGIGGSPSYNDGALVEFDNAGNPTYLNYGCQALVASLNTNAGSDRIFCSAATIYLYGNVTGNYTSLQWSGGTGTFNPPDSVVTGYITTLADTGLVPMWLTATGACGTTSTDTIYVYFPQTSIPPVLSAAGFTITCSIQSTSLGYSWLLNGSPTVGNSYVLIAPTTGCYSVIVTDSFGCSVTSDTVCIINVGINDVMGSFSIGLQPNPAEGLQHLKITSLQFINSLTLQLIDVTGQQIIIKNYDVMNDKFETNLDLSALSKGIYFLKVQTDEGSKMMKVVRE
ncbi:MAG: T9SS type A sorting domain-containing protein [Bacteroidia bacterium]